MILFWVILFIIILLFTSIFFLKWLKRPHKHNISKLQEIKKHVDFFANKLNEGSILFITHRKSKMFIQFVKRNNGIHFGYPDTLWSHKFFKPMKSQFLLNNKYNCEVTYTGDKIGVTKFLTIDELKPNDIEEIAISAFNIMGINSSDDFFVHYHGSYLSK